ncbi:MAG: sensor histidine kinase [Candidatus Acidiferrales bacterium]
MLERRWLRWFLIFLGWTAIGLFFTSQSYITYKYAGGRVLLGVILKLQMGEWYAWGLIAPLLVWLARRFPLERGRWARNLPVHIAASVAVAFLKVELDNLVRHYVLLIPGKMAPAYKLHLNLTTYWIIVGATVGFDFYRRYREGELRSSQLTAQLAEARLQALQMQLHPHFLFNTLNSISTLVHRDPEAADRMIARLSELLRMTLEDGGVQEVPLQKELEFLERYLEIERIRFADRLTIQMEIAPETLVARTPYLILQPLVENAIRHGVAPRSRPGRVVVRSHRRDGMLVLEVQDDGPGLVEVLAGGAAETAKPKNGVGVSSTRARLEQLYGSSQKFELKNGADGGAIAVISLPFRTASLGSRNRGADEAANPDRG